MVDFDGQVAPYNTSGIQPIVGPAITKLAEQRVSSTTEPSLGFVMYSAADFNYDPIAVRQAVYDWHHWAAIIINANATSALYTAVQEGQTSYEPIGACQLIYQDARDDTAWFDFILPFLSPFMTQATSQVGSQWAQMVLQNATTNSTLRANIAQVPQAISPAIGFSVFNLRVFYPYQSIPSITVGLIYLIILSFFSFSFYLPIYMKLIKGPGHPPVKFWEMVVFRYFGIQFAYGCLSLAYSLVSLAFQINFSTPNPVQSDTMVVQSIGGAGNAPKFGAATFLVFVRLSPFALAEYD